MKRADGEARKLESVVMKQLHKIMSLEEVVRADFERELRHAKNVKSLKNKAKEANRKIKEAVEACKDERLKSEALQCDLRTTKNKLYIKDCRLKNRTRALKQARSKLKDKMFPSMRTVPYTCLCMCS